MSKTTTSQKAKEEAYNAMSRDYERLFNVRQKVVHEIAWAEAHGSAVVPTAVLREITDFPKRLDRKEASER